MVVACGERAGAGLFVWFPLFLQQVFTPHRYYLNGDMGNLFEGEMRRDAIVLKPFSSEDHRSCQNKETWRSRTRSTIDDPTTVKGQSDGINTFAGAVQTRGNPIPLFGDSRSSCIS